MKYDQIHQPISTPGKGSLYFEQTPNLQSYKGIPIEKIIIFSFIIFP